MHREEAFFGWLDLNRDGLEAVKAGVEQNDYGKAGEALLAYFRSRDNVNFYAGWERPTGAIAFDRTKADAIGRNHLVHQDLPEDIDWKADPHGDPEWAYCLNRHEFLTELGRAYWYTGDDKYTLAWKRILGDWIKKNPMPDLEWMLNVDGETSRKHFMQQGTWRPLTLGIRMYTSFVPCFYHFLHSPEFTPGFLITMLTSMVEHARHTRLYYTRHKSYFNVSPNWGLMESNGLAHMGILFPEFREANDWRCEAMSRFEEQIRMQLCEEGMQVERASGYHLVCTFCFVQILDLALRNNVRVSDTYKQNAEKMIDFVVRIMKPHGVYPMLKDADESDVFGERAYLTAFTWPAGADLNDPDAASRVLVIDGSYLRREGRVVLDSLSKVYFCATKNDDMLDMQLQGQSVVNALLRSAKKPASVRVNGQPVEPDYDEKAQKLWLSLREE